MLFRVLKKLEPIVALHLVEQQVGGQGWTFAADHIVPGTDKRVKYLHELYTIADPRCTTRVTVPTLWDKKTKRIVNNESSEIIRMFNTEFNAITGDFAPTSGRIRFFGEDITYMHPFERIRKGMRRTYQSSLLFRDLTVRDNLFLAVRGVSNARFSLRRAGPSHASNVATQELLERGRLTHIADEQVSSLAHGQQRQLEIAMALAGAPRLILFDEPAAGLSPAERRELVLLLTSLPSHMSFVLIEHDLEIALRVVERVTVMHNGSVVKTGTPSEIENDPQIQAIYMGGKH